MSTRIDVNHITRVEGHGNIVVEFSDGTLKECRFDIVEAPRFFEAMMLGRSYLEVAYIASRICGICSTGHTITSLRAVESALGIVPSEQTMLLRKLTFHGEILDSHILHAYMLVAPDFLGTGSVIPLVTSHPDIVARALRMKKLSGDLCKLITGRHTHPITMIAGGFTHFPSIENLEKIRQRLVQLRSDVDATVDLFASLSWPQFERETEYVSLSNPDEYAFIDGEITTSDGDQLSIDHYKQITNEYIVPHSSAKHTRHLRESYMVGALARFNNNYQNLHPRAQEAAHRFGMQPLVTNPYLNTAAQVVEIVHCVEDSILIIDQLFSSGISAEKPLPPVVRSGEGVGACEVPRGVLFHNYRIGDDGNIKDANCVIPTNQNLGNIEADMRTLVPEIADKPAEEIQFDLEMLVRAYDPCISCSVHVLRLDLI